MDTLRLVEVGTDGDLVLMTGDGRRFRLGVDEEVRSAVRRTRAATRPADDRGERPGPREVQARIRAGADAAEVAAQTGLDVDYVRRFEGPVLAERAHVSELARGSAVDRGDAALTLERVVLDVLTGEGYTADHVTWDARRVEGSRWHVLARARVGTATTEATWSFDTVTRSLEPADAAAERLTGAERRRRLSAVRESVFDVERPGPAPRARAGTVELLDALARQRGRRPVPAVAEEPPATRRPAGPEDDEAAPGPTHDGTAREDPDEVVADGGPDEDAVAVPAEPDEDRRQPDPPGQAARPSLGLVPPVAPSPGGRREDRAHARADEDPPEAPSIEPDLLSELDLDVPPARRVADEPRAPRVPSHGPGPAAAPAGAPGGDRRPRRRRAAVPSWDEIVFGAKRDD